MCLLNNNRYGKGKRNTVLETKRLCVSVAAKGIYSIWDPLGRDQLPYGGEKTGNYVIMSLKSRSR